MTFNTVRPLFVAGAGLVGLYVGYSWSYDAFAEVGPWVAVSVLVAAELVVLVRGVRERHDMGLPPLLLVVAVAGGVVGVFVHALAHVLSNL